MKTLGMVAWYLFWIGISLLCLVLGVGNFIQERTFLARAELDTGTITTYELHVRNDGRSEYCPRIEFTTKAGEPVAVQGNDCPNQPDASKIGQTVQVYYDPKDPNNYAEKYFLTGYDGLIFGLIGAVFFGLFWLIPLGIALLRKLTAPANASPQPSSARGANSILLQDAERYHANQRAAERPRNKTDNESSSDEQATLAQLEQQEEELKRKIEERRRQQGQ